MRAKARLPPIKHQQSPTDVRDSRPNPHSFLTLILFASCELLIDMSFFPFISNRMPITDPHCSLSTRSFHYQSHHQIHSSQFFDHSALRVCTPSSSPVFPNVLLHNVQYHPSPLTPSPHKPCNSPHPHIPSSNTIHPQHRLLSLLLLLLLLLLSLLITLL